MESLESLVNEALAIKEISLITDNLSLEITRFLSSSTKDRLEITRINLSLVALIKVYMHFLDHLENYSTLPKDERSFLINSGVYSIRGNLDQFIKTSKLFTDKKDISFKVINERDFRPENG